MFVSLETAYLDETDKETGKKPEGAPERLGWKSTSKPVYAWDSRYQAVIQDWGPRLQAIIGKTDGSWDTEFTVVDRSRNESTKVMNLKSQLENKLAHIRRKGAGRNQANSLSANEIMTILKNYVLWDNVEDSGTDPTPSVATPSADQHSSDFASKRLPPPSGMVTINGVLHPATTQQDSRTTNPQGNTQTLTGTDPSGYSIFCPPTAQPGQPSFTVDPEWDVTLPPLLHHDQQST
ncbi:hypothetical protein QFC22_005625 [Naganishia vaughanmartiniae]|uniref:Uncharacterized protein n=1 Tax=Naganishia vaughanmartiniae TaxID=1424756 RepID=A0ACC2WUD5_9TREE|nr:hypothetical protein QFC22_005625 [Naganishia vaughanmartiniae]